MTEQFSRGDRGQLADIFSRVARSLEPEPDVERTVRNIVAAVSASVPGAEHVGVSLLEQGRIRSVAPSSELVARLDEIQLELSDGPCVDATFSGQVYRTGDLAGDPRWPSFGRAASNLGVNSMLALRLFTANTLLGALNLYSPTRRRSTPKPSTWRSCSRHTPPWHWWAPTARHSYGPRSTPGTPSAWRRAS